MEKEMRRIGNIYDDKYSTGYAGNVWDKKGIAPTLMTMQGGESTAVHHCRGKRGIHNRSNEREESRQSFRQDSGNTNRAET